MMNKLNKSNKPLTKIAVGMLCVPIAIAIVIANLIGCGSSSPTADEPVGSSSSVEGMPTTAPDTVDPEYSGLPVISVDTQSGESITSRDEYVTAYIGMSSWEGNFPIEELEASVRCRGNFSYTGKSEKKSYKIKFNQRISPFGIGDKDKEWVLISNTVDRSLLRNCAAFEMAGVLDFSFVSDYIFCDLYINGEYRGVYMLCQQPSREKTGGDYLIELDGRAYQSYTLGVDYFTVGGKSYVIKNDEIADGDLEYVENYMLQTVSAIELGDFELICEYIDVDSFVDMYILQEFAMNIDVGWSSFYMTLDVGGKLACTCPWDFDLAYGNDAELGDAAYDYLYVGNSDMADQKNSNPLMYRLMEIDEFRQLVRQRWEQVSEEMVDAAINTIDEIYEEYRIDFEENFQVWQVLGTHYFPIPYSIEILKFHVDAVNQLCGWIYLRYDYLQSVFCS